MNIRLIESCILKEIRTVGHFFSTREGGTSAGLHKSLNLSYGSGDETPNVDVNFGILSKHIGIPKDRFFWCSQAHTEECVVLEEKNEKEIFGIKADAIITQKRKAVIGVRTADCCPILIADEKGQGIGAVHAGWQSTAAEILGKTIVKMEAVFGLSPSSLRVSIGPSIGACCYRIDDLRAKKIVEDIPFAGKFINARDGYKYLDLKGLNSEIALIRGVLPKNIDSSGFCTFCSRERFFSFRRDGEKSGRQFNGIWLC